MTTDRSHGAVLALSSWVSAGHVGLSAAAPALRALGLAVTELPSVLLSNHPGFPHVAAHPVPVADLAGFVAALDANGWLTAHTALLLGYMPSPDHVRFAAGLARDLRERAPGLRVVVDPILGDAPKGLYVPQAVAEAVREALVPLADVLTPNAFELDWLTGRPTSDLVSAEAAAAALREETGADILMTSPPYGAGQTGLLACSNRVRRYRAPCLQDVPHGTGDVFSGLIAGGLAPGAALGHVTALARASQEAPHLRIAECVADWSAAPPCPPDPEE